LQKKKKRKNKNHHLDVGRPNDKILDMPMPVSKFANGEFYHIFNRGVDKRNIFSEEYDIYRFLKSMELFNSTEPIGSIYEKTFTDKKFGRPTSKSDKSDKLVEFVCFCLNPNHYHVILEQITEGGISELMKRLGGGYTKYFNEKYKRTGSLFQGRFSPRAYCMVH